MDIIKAYLSEYMSIRQKEIEILHSDTSGRILGCDDTGSLTRLAKVRRNIVLGLQLGGQTLNH
jgi:hypothetical protein